MPKAEDPTVDELIRSKFYCSRKFTEEIEQIVMENKDMKYYMLKCFIFIFLI